MYMLSLSTVSQTSHPYMYIYIYFIRAADKKIVHEIPVCGDGDAARCTKIDKRTLVFVWMAFNLICHRFDLCVCFEPLNLLCIEITDANASNQSGAEQLFHGSIRVNKIDIRVQRLATLIFREQFNIVNRLWLLR